VDKSVKNVLKNALNAHPQREKHFGPKSRQYTYPFYINEL